MVAAPFERYSAGSAVPLAASTTPGRASTVLTSGGTEPVPNSIQSLVIETPIGTVVLAGQAVQSRAEWEGATDPTASGEPSAPDRDAYVRSVLLLRELEPMRVHFAHDPRIWELG